MKVFITDESARAYWNTIESIEDQTKPTKTVLLTRPAVGVRDLKQCGVPRSAIVDRTLHVLVDDYGLRRNNRYVTTHLVKVPFPSGSFRRVSDTVMIVSPELLFVRMAAKLNLWETIRLGYELCGTYIVNPADPARTERMPLTTPRKLESFAESANPMRGYKKALRALRFVAPLSNSPMETILALLLCLPCRYGGYGLPTPSMNLDINMSGQRVSFVESDTYRCDLYWRKQAYALEYYGRDWHTGAQQVAHDARRSGDLQYRGIDITVITFEQIETVEQVSILAKKVAKRLGVRLRKPQASCLQARKDLHAYLVGTRYEEE